MRTLLDERDRRTILYLYHVERYPAPRIAEMFGVRRNAVYRVVREAARTPGSPNPPAGVPAAGDSPGR